MGCRYSQRPALPLHRAMASLPNRCLEVVAGSVAWERSEMARAMAETVETVSSARPPKVSATSGIKSVPVARHAERLEASFR